MRFYVVACSMAVAVATNRSAVLACDFLGKHSKCNEYSRPKHERLTVAIAKHLRSFVCSRRNLSICSFVFLSNREILHPESAACFS